MNYIITENQSDYVDNFLKVKQLFFKFWDKNGPLLNDNIFKMFGFDGTGVEISGIRLINRNIFDFFREWYGEKGLIKAKEILSKDIHNILCGGYDFNIRIKNVNFERNGMVIMDVTVLLDGATVELIFDDGRVENLEDALNNEDYGFEIESEVQECVLDYFRDNLTMKTGYEYVLGSMDVK